jgi:hypothetical protein
MDKLQEILSSDMGHKEQVALIVEKAKGDAGVLAQVFELLRTGRDVDKGTAAEVMKFISKEKPEMMLPYVDLLVEYIDYKAPRVRWGCPEAIGNMAARYPHEVEKAIPRLLGNLNDKSTVVRWCAAYALTEIAKYNQVKQAELVGVMQKLMESEQNNGVRNLYVKALKVIQMAT